MPGLNPTPANYKVQNSNSVIVLIGDQQLAFAQTVTPSIDYGAEALYGIGSANPQEIQQLRSAMTIALDAFVLTSYGNTISNNGQSLDSVLYNNQVDICVVNKTKNKVIKTYVGCTAQNLNHTIGTNRPITEAITFMAIDVLDSTGVSVLGN